MLSLVQKLHNILNLVKDFEAGYSSDTAENGKMLIIYKGKRYFLKLQEVDNPSDSVFDDIDKLKYFN